MSIELSYLIDNNYAGKIAISIFVILGYVCYYRYSFYVKCWFYYKVEKDSKVEELDKTSKVDPSLLDEYKDL